MKPPEFKVVYEDMIFDMKQALIKDGKMMPLKLEVYIRQIEAEAEAYENIYKDFLSREWNDLFPGIPFSESLLEQKLKSAVEEKKTRAIKNFKKFLKREENLRIFSGRVFKKSVFILISCFLISLVTIPFFLNLAFLPDDLNLAIGATGIVANVAILAFTFFRA